MRKIGIIEDDEKLCKELVFFLKNNGYEAVGLSVEEFNVECIIKKKMDLLLLDISLPQSDGLYLCKEIRKISELPIIMITSQNTEMVELMSMNSGADDFVSKPFHPQILLARIEAVLKRTYRESNEAIIDLGIFKLHISKGVVSSLQGDIELTKNELKILYFLVKRRNCIVSRDDIISHLWDSELFVDDNTLTVNMTRIRGKLESIGI